MARKDYIVDGHSPGGFADAEFTEASGFRDWLLRDRREEDDSPAPPGYRLVCSIVEEMCRCRFMADESFAEHDFMVRSKLRELPLPERQVVDMFVNGRNGEPPETMITRIAQRQFHVFDEVLTNIRKLLRRERELTRLSNIQQIDPQCMVWLTRQPGTTAVQKAGTKQKLMAVVRRESFDILENRVLKAVLVLCASYSRRYLREYGKAFEQTERVRAVQRLYCMAKAGLLMEEMGNVTALREMPKPNYVLMHDRNYSRIWQIYLDLLRQTALMEQAWHIRHRMFRQHLLFSFALAIKFEFGREVCFDTPFYWFSSDLRHGDGFLRRTSLRRIFAVGQTILDFIPGDEDYVASGRHCASFYDAEGGCRHRVSAVYLPEGKKLVLPPQNGHTYFVFDESGGGTRDPRRDDSVLITADKSMFYQVDDWLLSFL